MRTTIDIDDDVLLAAKELARASNRTAGALISELARKSLTASAQRSIATKTTFGIAPFAAKAGKPVSTAEVLALQDDEGLER
jgi:predicted transcriptional regulator